MALLHVALLCMVLLHPSMTQMGHAVALMSPPKSSASQVSKRSTDKIINGARPQAVTQQRRANLTEDNPHLVPIQHARQTRCICPHRPSFEMRFRRSYSVVRVKVIRETVNYDFTMGGLLKRFIIFEYQLLVTGLFKGSHPRNRSFFYAQAFKHDDLCGLRLSVGKQYLLNLDDPKKHSSGSFRKPGFFELDRCQFHFLWTKLSWSQQRYLLARAK